MSAGMKASWFVAAWLVVIPASYVRAQTCEATGEDSGVCDGEDAGDTTVTGVDASGPDVACSCINDLESNDLGNIHICTEARSEKACASLTCERGSLRAVECPVSRASLCCEIPSRDTFVQLYEDCDHPNCTAGFLAQCDDLGGQVFEDSCKHPGPVYEGNSSFSDDGGDCSVTNAGARRSHPLQGVLVGLALGLALFRRRKRA